MDRPKTNKCFSCGAPMVWETRQDFVEYQGHRREYPCTGWWCTKCPEGILTGAELRRGFDVAAELRAEVDGVLKPIEVRTIREQLGLSASDAARLLGGGTKAFFKYERGATPPSVAMSNLLRLLARDPRRLAELPAFQAAKAGGRLQYVAAVTREGARFLAEFPDCPGCSTFSDSMRGLTKDAREALQGWLEAELDAGRVPKQPSRRARAHGLAVSVDVKIAARLMDLWASVGEDAPTMRRRRPSPAKGLAGCSSRDGVHGPGAAGDGAAMSEARAMSRRVKVEVRFTIDVELPDGCNIEDIECPGTCSNSGPAGAAIVAHMAAHAAAGTCWACACEASGGFALCLEHQPPLEPSEPSPRIVWKDVT